MQGLATSWVISSIPSHLQKHRRIAAEHVIFRVRAALWRVLNARATTMAFHKMSREI